MTLGERIYKLRTEKEMSQGDLADALLAINLIPPSFGIIEHSTPATPVPDASVGLDN